MDMIKKYKEGNKLNLSRDSISAEREPPPHKNKQTNKETNKRKSNKHRF